MPNDKPKRPWAGFGFVVILVVAILVGYFLLYPIGKKVRDVFQTLTNALGGNK